MLNKLFRPKWQHDNPEVRKAAIEKLGANELDILKQIATTDTAEDIRQLAICKISVPSVILNLAETAQHAKDTPLLWKHWAKLMGDSQVVSAFDAEQFVSGCQKTQQLNAIIGHSGNNSLVNLALAGLNDEPSLLDLLTNSEHRVRQMVVEKLHSEDALKQALQLVKGKDKKSSQFIKTKLDWIKAERETQNQRQARLDKLLEKLDTLLSHESPMHLEGEVMALTAGWQHIKDDQPIEGKQWIGDDVQARVQDGLQQLQHKVDAIQALEAENAQFAEQQALKKAETASLQTDINQLSEHILHWPESAIEGGLEGCEEQLRTIKSDFSSHEDVLDKGEYRQLQQMLQAAENQFSATKLLDTNAELLTPLTDHGEKSVKQRIGKLEALAAQLTELKMPQTSTAQAQLHEQLNTLKNNAHETRAQEQQQLNKIQEWLNAADQAMDEKNAGDARRNLSRARNACHKLSKAKARPFQAALARLSAALNDLEDWKRFSTDPKRQALCDAMKNLAEMELPTQDKAREIHALQEQWKALGYCQDQALWDTFKQLAEVAYTPCKEAFEQQKSHRTFNAEQRSIICEQLETYLSQHDWSHTDWQALDKLYQNVVNEWKRFSPVEREAHQMLQDRFSQSAGNIKKHLQDHKKANLQQLEQLVEQAAALKEGSSEAVDMHSTIDSYQVLLNEWKSVGLVYHKQRQQLWQKFKAAGDALYSERKNQRESADQARHQTLQDANTLIDRIEAIAAAITEYSGDNKPANLTQEWKDKQQAFNALEELPHKAKNAVFKRLEKANNAVKHALRIQKQQGWLASLDRLLQLDNNLATLESNNDEITHLDPDALAAFPANWQSALQQRVDAPIVTTANETHRQCVDMEILLNVESPETDRELRMTMQMEKLADGLGQASNANEELLQQAICQWIQTKWVEKDDNSPTHDALNERVRQAVHSYREKHPI